ncbi:baseplate J/gp47 family protein [Candidatus Pacearchaeota archaeon]|nr:baseplate J/gp47 family protein [Candidatus Pacearchaeota archaeon]
MSTYTSAGVVLDRYADVLARLHAIAKAQWGEGIDLELDSYYGHTMNLIALLVSEMNEIIQEIYDAGDIDNAEGKALEAAVSFLGLERQEAAPSTIEQIQLALSRADTVPAGSLYKTSSDVTFQTDTELVLTAAGTGIVAGTCTVNGAIDVGINELDEIKTSGYGVTAVTNLTAAVPGRLRQTDTELKLAHSLAVETSGLSDVASIYEALFQVPGVSAVHVFENDTQLTVTGVPSKTIYVVVIGGTDAAVAKAIDDNKTSGVPTHGDETVPVYNETTSQVKDINLDRGATVSVYLKLTITKIAGQYPDDGDNQIKEGMASLYSTKLLNSDVIYNEHWGKIYAVPGLDVVSFFVGLAPSPTGEADIAMTRKQQPTLDVVRNETTQELISLNVEIVES